MLFSIPVLTHCGMKAKISNVDVKPYRMEFNLAETDNSYPRLRVTHRYTPNTLGSITLTPGPVVSVSLEEENVTLKRPVTVQKEEILMSSRGPAKPSLLKKLLPKAEHGVELRVQSKGAKHTLETVLPEGREFSLRLDYHATSLISFYVGAGPVLSMFLMNGNLWLAEDADTEMCIMSTERGFDTDEARFTYYDTPF